MAKRKMGKAVEKAREVRRRKRTMYKTAIGFGKDILVAVVIVLIVMGTLYAYSGGIWPPMVVVESESMMHGTDSQVGIIDTGDLTLVKKVDTRHDITTYVEGRGTYTVQWTEYIKNGTTVTQHPQSIVFHGDKAGFRAYGDYGDVVIYKKNGRSQETPVIHRAMVWFQPNVTNDCKSKVPTGVGGGDYPDIKSSVYPKGLMCVPELTIKDVGYRHEDLIVNAKVMISNAENVQKTAFAGFITKGDHNPGPSPDQGSLYDNLGRPFAPNQLSWIVGKAEGELPWFGTLKLVSSGTVPSDKIPPSSWKGLVSTIVLIIVIPFILDLALSMYSKRKAKNAESKGDEKADDDETPDETKEDGEDDDEDVDLDDEYGDEFKDMAGQRPKKK